MTGYALRIEQLCKKYRLGLEHRRNTTLAGSIGSLITSPVRNFRHLRSLNRFEGPDSGTVVQALRDVTFDVASGEVVGIIGRNGAGKSTLLKVLSRITEPTSGRVRVRGRVASLLEIGTGFHPELTGRENVYMNGTVLGMTRREIDTKFDEIVQFAGVERFIDTPVKRYSSGMQVRLAFSVAAHLEPEILVVDEVLAVGDSEFQAKCLGKMREVSRSEGRTVLFVSHNLSAVKRLCGRCVLLERGEVEAIGDTSEVVRRYFSRGAASRRELEWKHGSAPASAELSFESVRIADSNGSTWGLLSTSDDVSVEVGYMVHKKVADVRITMVLLSEDGVEILATSDFAFQGTRRVREPGRYTSVCVIPGDFLNTGRYTVALHADIPGVTALVEDIQLSFEVSELSVNHLGMSLTGRPGGLLHPNLSWRVTREAPGEPQAAGI